MAMKNNVRLFIQPRKVPARPPLNHGDGLYHTTEAQGLISRHTAANEVGAPAYSSTGLSNRDGKPRFRLLSR